MSDLPIEGRLARELADYTDGSKTSEGTGSSTYFQYFGVVRNPQKVPKGEEKIPSKNHLLR